MQEEENHISQAPYTGENVRYEVHTSLTFKIKQLKPSRLTYSLRMSETIKNGGRRKTKVILYWQI